MKKELKKSIKSLESNIMSVWAYTIQARDMHIFEETGVFELYTREELVGLQMGNVINYMRAMGYSTQNLVENINSHNSITQKKIVQLKAELRLAK